MMLNNDINSLQYANHLCNQYGLDTIAAGATLAFAMECFENGLITKEDTDGIDLRWGNTDAIMAALHKIGTKEGAFGELFGDGVKAASAKIGPKSIEFAMEVGGEELPMHDAKLQPEYYTTYKLDADARAPHAVRGRRLGRSGTWRSRRRTASRRRSAASTTRTRPSTCTSSTHRACACSS